LTFAVVALLVLAACGEPTEGKFGEELYEVSCAHCHASDGSGTVAWPPIGAGSDAVDLEDGQIRGVIRVGPGAMPAFPRLTDEQVDSLVEHVRLLQRGG